MDQFHKIQISQLDHAEPFQRENKKQEAFSKKYSTGAVIDPNGYLYWKKCVCVCIAFDNLGALYFETDLSKGVKRKLIKSTYNCRRTWTFKQTSSTQTLKLRSANKNHY